MTIVAHFDIEFAQYLGRDGKPTGDLPGIALDRDRMVSLYRWMVLTRSFDARAIALQRTGRLGTYASSPWQEAVSVGLADAMNTPP